MLLQPSQIDLPFHPPTRALVLLLVTALVALGGCAPEAEEGSDVEPATGHLKVRALYASDGAPADDARFAVETPDGERAAGPTGRSELDLEAGRYRVTATVDQAEGASDVEIQGGEHTDLEIVLDAGVLEVAALAAEGGSPMDDARYRILSAETDIRGDRRSIVGPTSRTSFVLPAGSYLVRAEEDQAAAEQEIRVSAGERTETQIVLNAGVLQARAIEADGSSPADRVRWQILSTQEDLRGRRETVVGTTSRAQFVLPAGEYLLQARTNGRVTQQSVEIQAGERVEVELTLPVPEEEAAEGG